MHVLLLLVLSFFGLVFLVEGSNLIREWRKVQLRANTSEGDLARLQDEVERLSSEVARLSEEQSFMVQLLSHAKASQLQGGDGSAAQISDKNERIEPS